MKNVDGAFVHQFEIDKDMGVNTAVKDKFSVEIDLPPGFSTLLVDLVDDDFLRYPYRRWISWLSNDNTVTENEIHDPIPFRERHLPNNEWELR